jgi:hypothetical protein
MPPQDAVILDNFFPTPTTCDLRKGYEKWSTGYPDAAESLMPYQSATTGKLFAASGTAFYDATGIGAVGAAVVTGLTNARWEHANMGTPGGQFMVCVNGLDKLRLYNGTAWVTVDGTSTPAITGIATTSLVHVNLFKNRLYFVEKDSFSIWYLPLNSIAGAATELDLSPLFKLGGYLQAMGTWTIDNASGVQEYACFISSEGEVALYQGYDPSTVGSWALVGMFRVGKPVGRRCFVKIGSDLILISADGFMPLSKALLTDRSQQQDALSAKIVNLVNNDVQLYGSNFGWQPILYPIGNKFIINVPLVEGQRQYQYVMNTITGAWCRFTGWNANCFATLGDSLYFGSNIAGVNTGFVAKCDVGSADDGTFIPGEAKTAFQYFGNPGLLKRFTMSRPVFLTAGLLSPAIGIDVDFNNQGPTSQASFSSYVGAVWGDSWGDSWGAGYSIQKDWQWVSGIGYAAALHMKVVNNVSSLQWMSVDYCFETGGIL